MNKYIKEINKVLLSIDKAKVQDVVSLLTYLSRLNTVFVAGNGGSFCDAQHFAEDLISYVLNKKGSPIKSHVLGGNPGLFSALSNDYGYPIAFLEELKTYSKLGDILVVFSGSGNSKNLVEACKWANKNGMTTVSFTGFEGGELKETSYININIPSENWGIIHGCHSLIFHYIIDRYL